MSDEQLGLDPEGHREAPVPAALPVGDRPAGDADARSARRSGTSPGSRRSAASGNWRSSRTLAPEQLATRIATLETKVTAAVPGKRVAYRQAKRLKRFHATKTASTEPAVAGAAGRRGAVSNGRHDRRRPDEDDRPAHRWQGIVTRDKMDKTRRVEVERLVRTRSTASSSSGGPSATSTTRRTSRTWATRSRSSRRRPLSKLKRWGLVRVVTKAPSRTLSNLEGAVAGADAAQTATAKPEETK